MPRKAKKNGSKVPHREPAPEPKPDPVTETDVTPPSASNTKALTASEREELEAIENSLQALKLKHSNLRVDFLSKEEALRASIAAESKSYQDRVALLARRHNLNIDNEAWQLNTTTYEFFRAP